MVQVTADSAQIDAMIMQWVYISVAAIIVVIILVFLWVWDNHRTPKPSKDLKKSHLLKFPTMLVLGLDFVADFLPVKEFIPEVLETLNLNKNNLLSPKPAKTYRFALPQKRNVPYADVAPDKDPVLTQRYMQALNDLANQKVIIRGLNMPMFVAIKNRAIAASFPFLGALNWTKQLETLLKDRKIIDALKNSKDNQAKELGGVLDQMALGISTLDFPAIYTNIDEHWDPTVNDSVRERDKTDGREERGQDKDKGMKSVMAIGIIMIILALIVVIAAKVL